MKVRLCYNPLADRHLFGCRLAGLIMHDKSVIIILIAWLFLGGSEKVGLWMGKEGHLKVLVIG